jgi:carboxypeptidase C (cathepsin A)
MSHRTIALIFATALAATSLQAQPPQPPQRPEQPPARQQAEGPRDQRRTYEVAGEAEANISETSHTMRLGGQEIRYTAHAGTLPIRLDNGDLGGRMFFVSYTRSGEDPRTRPVAFLFNGGPGSASIWLHMGSFAPVRAEMAAEGFQPAPPYRLVPNEHSLLDVADVVFIDAMSTGYSRTVAGVDPRQFHGVRGDLRAFGGFIREYLTHFDRWSSPKFVIGESYGSIRSAGLVGELQNRHGIELNGVVLLSALLSYQTIRNAPQNDLAYVVLVPTYAATAWYHKRLPADLAAKSLKAVVDEARAFAFGEYAAALVKGNTLTKAEVQATAQKLARYTGLPAAYLERTNLRVSASRYRKELLREQRLSLGRLDSRFTAVDLDAAGEAPEFDPSNTALAGPYVAAFSEYVRDTLNWKSGLSYPTSGNVRPWSWDEFENQYMDMTEELRAAMARNTHLQLLGVAGYYDLATPVGGLEYNLWHLGYDETFTKRVGITYYEGGHMMYIRPSAHAQLKEDIARFIRQASRSGAVQTSTR